MPPRPVTAAIVVVLLLAMPGGLRAIEELEAEESIAELLPNKVPTGERRRDLRARPWALLPQVGFAPDTGPMAGAKFAHRDLFETGTAMDLDATYAWNEQQSFSFSLGSPELLDGRFLVLLRFKYYFDPQRDFFGLGNNDKPEPSPASTHAFQEVGGAVTVGWRPLQRLAFNFAVGLRDVGIRRGELLRGTPSTVDAFPELPGIQGGIVNPIALSLVWNTRDDVMRPTRGWRWILKVIHTNRALFSDFDFTRFVIDAGYLRSFWGGRQIFGVRVNGEWIEAPTKQVPFWEMVELGGQDTLRGFFPHRFVGKGRVLFNGEYRFRLADFRFYDLWHVQLDGVLFGDGGRVFIDRRDLEEEFELNRQLIERVIGDFQYSAGAGFRVALSQALVARIDVGFSDEELGLVYLSFGHTF